jgi:hypothetical protein
MAVRTSTKYVTFMKNVFIVGHLTRDPVEEEYGVLFKKF